MLMKKFLIVGGVMSLLTVGVVATAWIWREIRNTWGVGYLDESDFI